MDGKEPGQRERPQHFPASHDPHQELSDHRHGAHHIEPDLRRPIGRLIPRQQVAGEGEGHHQEKEHHAHHPHHFARRLIRPIQERLEHMQPDRHHHSGGSPVVEAAHERAECDLFFNELNTVVGMIGRRRIVQGEEHAGDGLQQEEKQRGRAEDINPAGAARDGFVQKSLFNRLQIEPAIKPGINSRGHVTFLCLRSREERDKRGSREKHQLRFTHCARARRSGAIRTPRLPGFRA